MELSREEMIAAYKSGCSLDTLASRFAVNPSTVRRYLISWGVVLRPQVRTGPLFGKESAVEDAYRSGMNTRQIAKQFHADRNTVSKLLKDKKILRKTSLNAREFNIDGEGNRGVLAGLISGEGSITLRREKLGTRVIVSIVNTDPDIIDWLARLGGRHYWASPHGTGIRPVGTWRLSRAVDVFHCLTATLPWIFGKKRLLAKQGIELLKARYGLRGTRELVGLSATSRMGSSYRHLISA